METYTRTLSLSTRRSGSLESSSSSNQTPSHSTIKTLVRVTLKYPLPSLTPNSNSLQLDDRELSLLLTSDTDPLFHYTFTIKENEYTHFKSTQGLLVDFTSFPTQLIHLLEKCENQKFILTLRQHHNSNGKFIFISIEVQSIYERRINKL